MTQLNQQESQLVAMVEGSFRSRRGWLWLLLASGVWVSGAVQANDCGPALVDGDLNVNIPGAKVGEIDYQAELIKNQDFSWDLGNAVPSTCQWNAANCVAVSENLDLTLTKVELDGQPYTVILKFDETSLFVGLRWFYQTHFVSGDDWRLTKIEFDKGKDGSINKVISFSYDVNGYLVKMFEESNGRVVEESSFTYNTEGQLIEIEVKEEYKGEEDVIRMIFGVDGLIEMGNENENERWVAIFTYDANGKAVTMEHFKEGVLESVMTFTYDANGYLTEMVEDEEVSFSFSYDNDGKVNKSEGNQVIRHYTWEKYRLT